ncbi:MAG TPA: hypothetical protein VIF57_05335 [Polyangia bacterium]|jgi:hypothetical protein
MVRGEQSSPTPHAIAMRRRRLLALLGAAALLLLARPAAAQLRTCVHIEPGHGDGEALARLVKSEIDRHPTHRAGAADCQAQLTVEIIDLGPSEQWVNGRINTQVPYRERVGAEGLGPAVQRLLTVVLANDPLILQGPEANTWLNRQRRALERRSAMHYGGEVYQLASPVGGSFDQLAGVALTLRREVSALHIGVRLGGAFSPGGKPNELRLRLQFDAQVEAGLYATPNDNTSLFASALVGLVHYRFAGPATLDGDGATGTASNSGLTLGARAGVETMRTADVRALFFIQVMFPVFVSSDSDHGVVNEWVPSAGAGAGLLF